MLHDRVEKSQFNLGQLNILYHINYGVIQGFPALRKAVTAHAKKYDILSRVFDIANQLLSRHSPFASISQVDERTAKPSLFFIHGCLTEFFYFSIMAIKTLKNPYRLQKVMLKFPRRGKKPKHEMKNQKFRIQWLW